MNNNLMIYTMKAGYDIGNYSLYDIGLFNSKTDKQAT